MIRSAFLSLAVVIGVVVQGIPQHRFQPYHFSITAGKSQRGASLGVEGGEFAVSESPIVESVPSVAEVPASLDNQAAQKPFQEEWKKAAINLASIPNLLQWVSSLNPEAWMEKAIGNQDSQIETVAGEESTIFVEAKSDPVVETEPEIVTENYENDFTTEAYVPEEITQEPFVLSPVPVAEQQEAIYATQDESLPIENQVQDTSVILQTEEPILEDIVVEKVEAVQDTPIEETIIQPEVVTEDTKSTKTSKQTSEVPKKATEKKQFSKFRSNRFTSRRQSLNKGKTLFSFAPEPQPQTTGFVFPSYSYSISHQPVYGGR